MALFEKEKNIRRLKQEFDQLDKFYNDLSLRFIEHIKSIIAAYYPYFETNKKNNVYFRLFATHLINSTETVIDKASRYDAYRLKEEVKNMNKVAKSELEHAINIPFEKGFFKTVKKFLVDNFPDIYELNADGFRLLETNTNIYTHYFLVDFYFDEYFSK